MEGSYSGQKILVVGAARSGTAAAEFLLSRGAHVVLTDTRNEGLLAASLAPLRAAARTAGELTLELGGHKAGSFRDSSLVVVSPGVPLAHPLFEESRKAGIPVIAEIELAWRHIKGKILGITGSNGKTTTTSLVAELLRTAGLRGFAAGNIGTPLIAYASTSGPEDIYVVELSSFQLESIRDFRPYVAALLNLTPDHMDRYRGFEDYIDAKQRIFMNQSADDFAVLNADDPRTAALGSRVRSTPVWFSRLGQVRRGTFIEKGRIIYRDDSGDTELLSAGDIRLKGSHNLENVLAACAIARLAGAAHPGMARGIRDFSGVEHRLEFVAELDGVQYFNDSKATNVDAAIKSLEAFAGNIVLIAGGRDKGGDFLPLRALVSQRVKHLILIGEAAGKMRSALSGAVTTSTAASLPQAVERAREQSRPGDIVLLAPACASFDMFDDYEHRGRVFKEAVLSLARK
jgi:UDP-N-acetylmuramoylalanine--D-glutamate ligase